MEISQASLAQLYFCAMLLGIALGAVYDLLRITRIFFGVRYSGKGVARLQRIRLPLLGGCRKRRELGGLGVLIFFEDLLFCLLAGVSLIILFYECNNGKIRYPVFLIAGAGFLLYRATLGRLVMLLSEWIAFFVGAAVRYLIFFVTLPFRVLLVKLRRTVKRVAERSVVTHQKRGRRRYTKRESQRGMENACGLVPEGMPRKAHGLKRGKRLVKQQKAIQPDVAGADPFGGAGSGVHRRVRKQRDEI